MRTSKIIEGRSCPHCSSAEKQTNVGFNKSGTQRCRCNCCGKYYTLNPKERAYSEEVRQNAIRTYHSGASGREVGKIFGMSKANVYHWIKKAEQAPVQPDRAYEEE
jgi:transposase-like protein